MKDNGTLINDYETMIVGIWRDSTIHDANDRCDTIIEQLCIDAQARIISTDAAVRLRQCAISEFNARVPYITWRRW